ncbi:amyloid protein-binding protein 2-like [Oppia nitens]|uniref:amyloid protein-binding protein 2-like n=1 Tax=Oppia nitens TaxID=1686743 RepID=UPI0023DAA80F|nr:amyloid protein-binding protein 2-like [Oppia nitens]
MSCRRLYESCVSIVSKIDFIVYESNSLKCLPTNVLFDVLYYMSLNGNYYYLENYFIDLDIIYRFITEIKAKRNSLHYMFQSLMDFDLNIGTKIVNKWKYVAQHHVVKDINNITANSSSSLKSLNSEAIDRWTASKFGLCFATFLKESGWYELSRDVLEQTICLYEDEEVGKEDKIFDIIFECKWKLLSVLNSFCNFEEAMEQKDEILELINYFELFSDSKRFNISQVYTEFAQLFFFQSYYDESYQWAVRAIENLSPQTPVQTVIDVYRQAAKTAVVKRDFKRAETLINQAMILCKETFGVNEENTKYSIGVIHLKLADVFLDYGFYLLNVDLISHSVKLYEMALEIREYIFGLNDNSVTNLLIAITHEELGYASYVHEYSSGNFLSASFHANKAMAIVTQLVPTNHLLLASAKRVKALILEEIAIDHHDKDEECRMLAQSRELHLSALDMARSAFGEINVQTAKHYGNLGRLYQSMKRYKDAEEMHLKAIQIKEKLLGPEDYEVALSLGHLASLYNYDMEHYLKAEKLYLRSIEIGVKLFGHGYSGLEYDYRGLCRVYSKLQNGGELHKYMRLLNQWRDLREDITRAVHESPPIKDLNKMKRLSPDMVIAIIEKQMTT